MTGSDHAQLPGLRYHVTKLWGQPCLPLVMAIGICIYVCFTTGTVDPQLSDPHIPDLFVSVFILKQTRKQRSTGLHLVTLFLDDDWLVGASPHVIHTPNRVAP